MLKSGLTASLTAAIAIVALSMAGLMHLTPPEPLPASAPATAFSSARALRHLKIIARQPHPVGTTEHAKVRDYLLVELKALGLEPQIQTAFATNNRDRMRSAGIVENVLVRIPGKVADKALLVAAHYDSRYTGPGAADDGASVAAMLEMLRALKNLPALQNDLICLFSDGEEAGLLGAEAFVAEHPWEKNTGLALNFEFRGNRGPMLMFETSTGNGRLIEGFAEAVPHPFGNSLMYEIYKRLPNDTDLTVFKQADIAGMNFAAIEGHTSYHTQLDRPELMQQASLQHEGETMLSLVQYFGNVDLSDLQSPDSVYFDMPGLGMVHYPAGLVIPLCLASVMLFGAMSTLGFKCGQLRAVRTALAVPVFVVMISLLAFACQWLWVFIKYLHPQYQLMPNGDAYNSHWYLPAFVLLTIALFSLIQSEIKRWLCSMEFMAGAMSVWLMLLIAASLGLPGASFLLLWPLLPAILAIGILFGLHDKNIPSALRITLIVLAAAPGILMFAPFIKLLFVALTPNRIGVVIGFLALLLGLLTPLLDILSGSFVLRCAPLITGFLLLLTGSLTAGFDLKHPRPNHLFHAQDSITGKAYWLSADPLLDEWTRAYFPAAGEKRQVPELFGEKSEFYWASPSLPLALPAPVIKLLEDSVRQKIRTIKIQVESLRRAPELHVFVEGVGVISSKLENRVFTQGYVPDWHVRGFDLSEQGLTIELAMKAGVPFKIRAIDYSYELSKTHLSPRPAGMISQPWGMSDTTAIVSTVVFK